MGNSSSTQENGQAPSEDQAPPPPSYYQMAKQGYQELVNAIIRPPRCEYSEQHLGPSQFEFCNKSFRRNDFNITNYRNLKVCCSHWEPKERVNPFLPCVIYMHGNSSSRLEVLPNLAMLLSLGITVLAFDFAGSGSSEGDYVSLGYFEKDDLDCVIRHLRDGNTTSTIALWGRSMGAATALLHGERDPSIAGMVLDSAFSSLVTLAEEMVEKGKEMGIPNIPQFVIRMAIRWIRSSVQKQAGFDIYELNPALHANQCFIPALFVAGEGDEFVPPSHSQKIHDLYAGDKNLVLVEGDHNSARPSFFSHSALIFLKTTLQIPEQWLLENGSDFTRGQMPWSASGRLRMGNFMGDFGGGEQEYLNFLLEDSVSGMGGDDLDGGLGMTTERQENVRNALYSMLGDTGANQRLNNQQNSSGTHSSNEVEVGDVSLENLTTVEEWSCTVCTLMNDGGVVVCSACGCANYKC